MRHIIALFFVCLVMILTQIEITGYIFQFFDIVAGEPPESWVLDPLVQLLAGDKPKSEDVIDIQ